MDPTDFVEKCHRSGCDFGPVRKGRDPSVGPEIPHETRRLLEAHPEAVSAGRGEDHRLILADNLEDQGHPFSQTLRDPEALIQHYGNHLSGQNSFHLTEAGRRMATNTARQDLARMKAGWLVPRFEQYLEQNVSERPEEPYAPSIRPTRFSRKAADLVRKAAMVAVSPSTETQDFPQAHSSLTSQNQQQLRGIAHQLFKQLGIKKGQLHDAIGDTAAWGAENSVAGWIDDDDIDDARVRYLAAWLGNRYNQKNVLKFIGHSNGKDLLHDVVVGDANLEGLRDSLTKHGLEYRTIIPSRDGRTRILMYDEGGRLAKNVGNFAETHRASLHTTPGTGEFIGDPAWASRPKARQQYRQTISEYEAAQGGGNPSGPPSLPARNAPAGGAVVRGQNYPGGQRLPDPY